MILGYQNNFGGTKLDLLLRNPFMIDGQMRQLAATKQSQVSPPMSVRTTLPTLQRESRGKMVKLLQLTLNQLGANPQLPGTEYFGIMTWKAVVDFQTKARLSPVDGIVGAKTWTAMERLLGKPIEPITAHSETPVITADDSGTGAKAVKNGAANLGKTSGTVTWNGVVSNGVWADPNVTYCARFARMCLGEPSRFASAIAMYEHFLNKNLIRTESICPAGAVVFYGKHAENWSYGHVGIADGKGKLYSPTSRKTGVTWLPVLNTFKAAYMGYVTADEFIKAH